MMDADKITRVEVVDESGRAYVNRNAEKVKISLQDDGGTLKVFIVGKNECLNSSGIHPQEYNCLVRPDDVEETTDGGVILPSQASDADRYRQTQGVLIEASPMAFKNPDWPKDKDHMKPQVGQSVYYARFAGANSKVVGKDGVEYIILKDIDITAVIED